MDDTIVSISTSLGVGAIAIIRLSGPKAIEIVNKIFKGKDLTKVDSHTINYGYIKENDTWLSRYAWKDAFKRGTRLGTTGYKKNS